MPLVKRLLALAPLAFATLAFAQATGGLYIAGAGFTFQQAVDQGLAMNPGGQRFFVLALPPQTQALAVNAPADLAALRDRAVRNGAELMVCERDVASGAVNSAQLVPGVVTVRGWPPPGSDALPAGQNYFPDENRADFPASEELLRRLRSACSS
jgi:predicted peroxiredoxin